MVSASKVEYPPLLPVGFHPMTLGEVRQLCVTRFPLSKTRDKIMHGLEVVIKTLRQEGIVADVWVDGSFLTEKIDPEDSDIVVRIENDVYVKGNPQQKSVIAWINNNLKASLLCDSYVHVEYPQGHALYSEGEWMRAYWIRQFGFSRGEEYKGMAVIQVS